MQTAFDFEPVFFGNVPVQIYDYTAHGDGSEFTLRRNRQAFDWVDIVPARAAIPASQVDLSSELLGVKMKFPIIVGPSTGQGALHPDGEIGMFRAATAASNTLMIIASGSTIPVAKVVTVRARRHAVGAVLSDRGSGRHPASDGQLPECSA